MSWNPPQDRMPLAWNHFNQGKFAEAESIAKSIVDWQPQNIQAVMMMGYSAARQGRLLDAEKWFRRGHGLTPAAFEPLNWLASILCQLGSFSDAKKFALRAVATEPKSGDAHNNLGLALMGLGDYKAATESFLDALHVEAPGAETLYNLGLAFYKAADYGEAIRAFEFHLQRNPNDLAGWMRLSEAFDNAGELRRAVAAAQKALELAPNSSEAQVSLGWALVNNGQADHGKGHLERAFQLDPESARTMTLLGASYQTLGNFSVAREWFTRAIAENGAHATAYYHLLQNERVGADLMPYVTQAAKLLEAPETSLQDKALLGYSLGKAFDNLKDYERAMEYFDFANGLLLEQKDRANPFDRKACAASTDRVIELYDRILVGGQDSVVSDSDLPILIVGMMRSGTTLMEQILSSHPEIAPGGEIGFPIREGTVMLPSDEEAPKALAEAGADYLRKLETFGPSRRVTDKLPGNYLATGLISTLFPNAKFIEMKRNPVDTCISAWTMALRVQPSFAHRKSDIVFAYRQYMRVMDAWRERLSSDTLSQVRYEALVEDREPILKAAVNFCGLDWDAALLNHEQNHRTVATPSLWQVRQPIYTSSRERWRNYEPWLGDFSELLQEA